MSCRMRREFRGAFLPVSQCSSMATQIIMGMCLSPISESRVAISLRIWRAWWVGILLAVAASWERTSGSASLAARRCNAFAKVSLACL